MTDPSLTTPSDALFGAWALIAAYLDISGQSRVDYFGVEPAGSLILDRSGRMVALLTAAERGTAPDAAALFGSMLAYAGAFTADATTFVTMVDAAWVPGWVGTRQMRHYTIAGDGLTIRSDPMRAPQVPDVDSVVVLEWRRAG